jgi:hypothetical protein
MKKIFFLLPIIVCMTIPLPRADAQLTAVIAAMDGGTIAYYAATVGYWLKQAEDMVDSIAQAKLQVEAMIRAEERALKNIQGITNVSSWGDLMDWANRQIYLERQAEARFNAIGVKIGDKTYSLKDIADIPEAMKDTYIDYWNKDFTEKQRKEMWYRLGLTPANYNYVQVWKERERLFIEKYMTKPEVINEEYTDSFIRLKEIREKLAEEKEKEEPDMDTKELLMMQVEMTTDLTKGVHDLNLTLAEMQEREAAKMLENKTPASSPPLSPDWNKSYFEPLTNR